MALLDFLLDIQWMADPRMSKHNSMSIKHKQYCSRFSSCDYGFLCIMPVVFISGGAYEHYITIIKSLTSYDQCIPVHVHKHDSSPTQLQCDLSWRDCGSARIWGRMNTRWRNASKTKFQLIFCCSKVNLKFNPSQSVKLQRGKTLIYVNESDIAKLFSGGGGTEPTFYVWLSASRKPTTTSSWTWSWRDARDGTLALSWCGAPTCTRRGIGHGRSATKTPSTLTTRPPIRCTTSKEGRGSLRVRTVRLGQRAIFLRAIMMTVCFRSFR